GKCLPMPAILMHCNYYEKQIPTLFDKAKFFGYDGVELRGSHEDLSTAQYVAFIKEQMDRTGLTNVVVACPCNLNNADADARAAEVEKASDLLRQAAGIGVNLFNTMAGSMVAQGVPYSEFHLNGSGCATWEQWAWAVEGYQALGAVASELGVKMAFETHNGYIHDLAKPCAEFLRRINSPAIGANLDMGNIVLNIKGEPLLVAIETLGDKLYYNHLKNIYKPSTGGYIVCALPDGVIDNRVWLRELQKAGNESPICLEEPRLGDRDYFAKQDIDYIRSILSDLAWS
ncbi:MAG: sugar phosphate isomerase/epimerase family protein, partial [Bacteroidota bacterium]